MRETADSDRSVTGKQMLLEAKGRIDAEQRQIERQRKAADKLPPERRSRLMRALAVQESELADRRKGLGQVLRNFVES